MGRASVTGPAAPQPECLLAGVQCQTAPPPPVHGGGGGSTLSPSGMVLTRFEAGWAWILVAVIAISLRGQEVGFLGRWRCSGLLRCRAGLQPGDRGPPVQVSASAGRALSQLLLKYSAHCHQVRWG